MRWLAGGRYAVKWIAPVYAGDALFPIAEAGEPSADQPGHLPLTVRIENGDGAIVMVGDAGVPTA
jgi:acyl dehydratase